MIEYLYMALSCGSLFLGAVLVFWLYRDYRIDSVRQDLFELRDRLFDEAVAGNVDFESPAYGMLRSTINGMIRFSHRLSLFNIVVLGIALGSRKNESNGPTFSERLFSEIENCPDEQGAVYMDYFVNMNRIMIRHMIKASPPLLFLALVSFAVSRSASFVSELQQTLKVPIDKFESAAFSEGELAKVPITA